MIQIKIWQRYLWWEILKVFALFITVLYLLYVLIDYAAHFKILQKQSIPWSEFVLYYLGHFFRRLQILVPFALMVSTVTILARLNLRRELLALQTVGFTRYKILKPFLYFALICLSAIYLNFEYVESAMLPYIDHFEAEYFRDGSSATNKKKTVGWLKLADGSHFIYQNYDFVQQRFYDVFWVVSIDTIYHMQSLQIAQPHSIGMYIDEFVRDSRGELKHLSAAKSRSLPQLALEKQALAQQLIPLENYPLSRLWQCTQAAAAMNSPATLYEIQTMFYFKCLLPLLCFWVVIMPMSWCFHFDRHFSAFRVHSKALFWLIFFFTSINAAVIVSNSSVASPLLIIAGTFGCFFLPFLVRFMRSLRL